MLKISVITLTLTIVITLVLVSTMTLVQAQTQTIMPNGGTCMGFITSPTYCKFLKMPDGSVIENTSWTTGKYTKDANKIYANDPYVGSTAPEPEQTQTQTIERTSSDGDKDTTGDADQEKTYCDVPNPSNPCHDRLDVDEETGLATCIDGSHEEDWRDCKGGGAEEEEDDTTGDADQTTGDAVGEGLPQEGGCQGDDDYCAADEGCRDDDVDCIDDSNFDEDDYNG